MSKKGMCERMNVYVCVYVCVVLAGTLNPMTSSTACLEMEQMSQHAQLMEVWKSKVVRSGKADEMGKFSIHRHRQCLYNGTTQCWQQQWDSTRLSYLCQVGIDPFRECPLLHCLLLICKSEPRASLSVTCNNKQRGYLNTNLSLSIVLRVDWVCRAGW